MDFTVDVVIPTCGRPEILERTLRSMVEAEWPACMGTVFVVENAREAGAKQVCKVYVDKIPIHYIFEPKVGSSFARNAGVDASRADIIIFLDDDVKVAEQIFVAYTRAFSSNGLDFFYGGPVAPDYEQAPPAWLEAHLPPSAKGFDLGVLVQEVQQGRFLGGNHAVPRKLLAEAELFDEVCAVGLGGALGEETRLQQRLLKKGYNGLYVPQALVWHYVPADRCTPEWALERSYRTGLTEGIVSVRERQPGRGVGGVPVWVWRLYFASRLHEFVGNVSGEEQDLRFGYAVQRRRIQGVIAGYRESRRVARKRQNATGKSGGWLR